MRNLTQPPPSMHCEVCDGLLQFKLTEPNDQAFDMEVQIFVCTKCGSEYARKVMRDRYAAHTA